MTKEEVRKARCEAEKAIIEKLEEIRRISIEFAESVGLSEVRLSIATSNDSVSAFSIVENGSTDADTVYLLDVCKWIEDGEIKEFEHAKYYGEENDGE